VSDADVRALAAGVISVGFDGHEVPTSILAARPFFGGFVLFGRNVRSLGQTRALTDALRAGFPPDLPPIIAIDQEGGRVARIRDGVEEIPSMMALGATRDPELANRAGEQIAFDLRRAGVNVNFAPDLDLALESTNTVIGTRAFGADPRRVIEMAGAVARGMSAGGVVPTFKHFPGPGSTAADPHLGLPKITLDAQRIRARDLAPFAQLLPSAPAVMTAHIVFESLDPGLPATLSAAILTGLLRDEIGFSGVCFTDCMQMDAIARTIGSAQGGVRALAAGADGLLISHDLDVALATVERIVTAVSTGVLPLARLREAHDRVHSLRRTLCAPLPPDAKPPHAGVGREIGRRAVTLLRGSALAGADTDVAVSFQSPTTEGAAGAHVEHASLTEYAPSLEEVIAPLAPDAGQIDVLVAAIRRSHRRPIVLMRRAHLSPAQTNAVRRILGVHADALLVSLREPYDATLFPQAHNVIATYGDDRPSMAGLADVLFAHRKATGQLPLELAAVG
jgi:beta-N-acetylhexosaminidase